MALDVIMLTGQSNADLMRPDDTPLVSNPRWLWVARSGSSLANDWGDESDLENALVATIDQLPSDINITMAWLQGENDSRFPVDAAAYEANRAALRTRVLADTGRSAIYTVELQLHDDLDPVVYTEQATVRTAKSDFVSGIGAAGTLIDPTLLGSLGVDDIHYDSDLRVAVASAIYAAHVAKFG